MRALDLRLERLEQTYRLSSDTGGRRAYAYAAPAFEVETVIVYDEHGLALDYPGIAVRIA